ncbi:MAG: hypothetical protein GF387_03220 [Candidatus Portnoybacteria bacterium]|nr:hypothetical protein [Candidatus Portnoybacteria bacterium]
MIIGLILGGVILAEDYHWITPKYEKIEEEMEKEKEEVVEIVPEKWTTYKNENYGYQVDYPTDWVLYSHLAFYVEFQTFSKEELGGKDCAIQKDCLSGTIEVNGSEFSSLEEWINKRQNDIEEAREQGLNWEIKEGEILVGGRKGYEFIAWIPRTSIIPAIHTVGVFEKGKLYNISAEGLELTLLKKYPKTFQQIVSSFKFVEQK